MSLSESEALDKTVSKQDLINLIKSRMLKNQANSSQQQQDINLI